MQVRSGEASGSNGAHVCDYGIFSWEFGVVQTGLMSGYWIQPKAIQHFANRVDVLIIVIATEG